VPPKPADAAHKKFMRLALKEARAAAAADEVPVGAVLVKDGRVIGSARNRNRALNDPTAHAEVLALRAGARRLQKDRLGGTILYVTVEPCPMCAGAAVLARLDAVVYGAADPKAGAGGTLFNVLCHPALNHRCGIVGGVLAEESRRLLRGFFRKKRARGGSQGDVNDLRQPKPSPRRHLLRRRAV
jgi:tRNA(adenine34) deaminase